MLLSVIVPVYNSIGYISRCLDSILCQQLEDMELICVDDGSTDGSGELLDQYALRDARVRVIHKANGGLVRARKSGLMEARGRYTAYVDSDDWVEPEMYGTLCDVARREGADMVCCGYILERGETRVSFYDGFPEGLYRDGELAALRDKVFFREEERTVGIRPSLCNKLFKTSLLVKAQSAVPDEVTECEDRLCTVACILEARSVYILRETLYHYVFRGGSMSHREDAYYLDRLGAAYRAFGKLYRHPNFSERLRIQCELYMVKMINDGVNSRLGFCVPDLMWISPRWMEKFPAHSKIVLYGAGRLGKVYYRQMMADRTERLRISGWVDGNYKRLEAYPRRIDSPEYLKTAEYDYVLLAVADRQPAREMREYLIRGCNVAEEKIVWLEPQELFWEYAEAAGLIVEMG